MRYRAFSCSIAAAIATVSMVPVLASCDRRPQPPPTTLRNERIQWYLHRASPIRSLSFRTEPTFVTFSTADPVPPRDQLVAALEYPESFAAAHMLLLNGPEPTTQPGTSEANTAHQYMALRLEADGRMTLQDQADGSCVAVIDGLRVVLRPAEKKGRYFGQGRRDHTIYAATAEIDEGQQRAIRDQWKRRPSP